jgi:hypothetical protein
MVLLIRVFTYSETTSYCFVQNLFDNRSIRIIQAFFSEIFWVECSPTLNFITFFIALILNERVAFMAKF